MITLLYLWPCSRLRGSSIWYVIIRGQCIKDPPTRLHQSLHLQSGYLNLQTNQHPKHPSQSALSTVFTTPCIFWHISASFILHILILASNHSRTLPYLLCLFFNTTVKAFIANLCLSVHYSLLEGEVLTTQLASYPKHIYTPRSSHSFPCFSSIQRQARLSHLWFLSIFSIDLV